MSTKKSENLKPGWRSTEFILTSLTALVGIAIAGGFVDPEGSSSIDKVAALVCSALAAVGYSFSRGLVKKADLDNK
tara:strand:+ start:185 stop:412 length:228 start_codon:yes stop_codon:yes gene_type:complete